MNTSRFTSAAFLALTLSAAAANVTLTDGRTFHDARVFSQTPRKVVLRHAGGLSSVEKNLLPPELAARYPVDEAAAREADQRLAEARIYAAEFHAKEAARAAQVRLAREDAVRENTRLANEAEARDLAATAAEEERPATAYSYLPLYRPTYRSYGTSWSSECEPVSYQKPRRENLACDDRSSPRTDHVNRAACRDDSARAHERPISPRTPPTLVFTPPSPSTARTEEDPQLRRFTASIAR